MRAYIIPLTDFGDGPEPDQQIAQVLPGALSAVLKSRGVEAKIEWYYDEFMDPVEHGVKIDIEGVDEDRFIQIIEQLAVHCEPFCEEVEIEYP